jgi:hypothetical protein
VRQLETVDHVLGRPTEIRQRHTWSFMPAWTTVEPTRMSTTAED